MESSFPSPDVTELHLIDQRQLFTGLGDASSEEIVNLHSKMLKIPPAEVLQL